MSPAVPTLEGFADEVNVAVIFGTRRKLPLLVEIATTPKSFTCTE